ncbi:NAD(P)-dependent oxidoreductase [Wukongibacter sp. M2B1]|uniref:NAD(P)-dependent oxidoreductase n=1 Tax=Wukongibacter sp. M2B1 TaxID=3088895 RepID=UPI003D7AC745
MKIKFNKIVSIDNTGLEKEVKAKLHDLADEVVLYDDYPTNNVDIISRIGDAECVLVSWNTRIDKEVIESCPSIKYIGMCCSLYDENSANVDINTAKKYGITVLGVRDYGDEGLVEFVISELIRLLHGFGKHQWKEEVLELTNQRLGIVGLGTTGIMLAEKAKAFGMEVFYYSRSRKLDLEKEGIKYRKLNDLLKEVDILSTHLPRNTIILREEGFELFGNNKILINTSLEPTFDVSSFVEWIKNKGNYAIFDRVAMGAFYEELKRNDKVIFSEKVSGWTKQAKERLSVKVLENIYGYLNLKSK